MCVYMRVCVYPCVRVRVCVCAYMYIEKVGWSYPPKGGIQSAGQCVCAGFGLTWYLNKLCKV